MERRLRLRLRCRGVLQGVGFRPTVVRVAAALGLAGTVANDGRGATVEIEGPADAVVAFLPRLRAELPPLARLDETTRERLTPIGQRTFAVLTSSHEAATTPLVPTDATLCRACRAELDDPTNRRHRYPFTTCGDCGPRYSLVTALPYDRSRTAMACFPLCPDCAAESVDPGNRRFRAEPVCCPACGPRLWLADRGGRELAVGTAALTATRAALDIGEIVAIKGLGSFQLACRADAGPAVALLRRRQRRPTEPFAVMVRDLAEAHASVVLDEAAAALLASPRNPVVLAPRRPGARIADEVAPGLADLGILLPTTALHVELFRDPAAPPLVMTSGTVGNQPICAGNREALARLDHQADLFLLHDRDIVHRLDDSVVRSAGGEPFLVRRSRGYVPEPLVLPAAGEPLVAVGGHLQVAGCVTRGGEAFLAAHVGDLASAAARTVLAASLRGLEGFLQVTPQTVIADAQPDSPSQWLARELAAARGGRLVLVQHHLAHAAAVLAEHRALPAAGERAVALVLDGAGWGADGSAWGGEWLAVAGDLSWSRLGHLEALPLVGGERAVREPWRVAVAALARAGAAELVPQLPLAAAASAPELTSVASLAAGSWPLTTSAGRLFEAGGALLGLAFVNSYEGEAAARLESLATAAGAVAPWPEVAVTTAADGPVLPSAALLAAAARRLVAGEPATRVAAGLHATFCCLAAAVTLVLAAPSERVAAAGGCLVNRLLRAGLERELEAVGHRLLLPVAAPPGDGGLAWGQVALVAAALNRHVELDRLAG